MKRIYEGKIGDCKIIIAKEKDSYRGVVLKEGQRKIDLDGDDLNALKAALRNHAGRLHPHYFGMDGAKARFLNFFPEGFDDPQYKYREREYKDKARAALVDEVPLDSAVSPNRDLAKACKKGMTNLLSQYEAARFNDILLSREGVDFVRASAEFTKSPSQAGLDAIVKAIEPHGKPSWPIVTYLPFMWEPSEHMFLKPNATVDFATRTGNAFASDYEAAISIEVYQALLYLADETWKEISGLNPKDRIDIQSFIWVVGSYLDEEAG